MESQQRQFKIYVLIVIYVIDVKEFQSLKTLVHVAEYCPW